MDGNPVDAAGLEAGVAVGDVTVGQMRQIVLEVTAVGAPAMGNTWSLVPQWEYDYVSCVGEPPLTEPHGLAPIFIDYDPSGSGSGTGSASASGGLDDTAGSADSNSGGASESGSGSASAGDTTEGRGDETGPIVISGSSTAGEGEDGGGCGCRSDRTGPSAWLWLLVAPIVIRRRRR